MTTYTFPIAPEDMSGAFCDSCGKHVKMNDEKKVIFGSYRCCGRVLKSENLFDNKQIALRSTSAKFVHTENIQSEVWLHATDRADWYNRLFSTPLTPLVHLGTLSSAWSRYTQLKNSPDSDIQDWQLHLISINAGATISPGIIRDDNGRAPRFVDDCRGIEEYEYDIVPYVNQWEAIGEVSLFANPEKITVLDTFNFVDLPATLSM